MPIGTTSKFPPTINTVPENFHSGLVRPEHFGIDINTSLMNLLYKYEHFHQVEV
jgi:hypothetical protein